MSEKLQTWKRNNTLSDTLVCWKNYKSELIAFVSKTSNQLLTVIFSGINKCILIFEYPNSEIFSTKFLYQVRNKTLKEKYILHRRVGSLYECIVEISSDWQFTIFLITLLMSSTIFLKTCWSDIAMIEKGRRCSIKSPH